MKYKIIKKPRKAQMPMFGWIFAVIVGTIILFLVIYFLGRAIKTETKQEEVILAKNFDILLNPFSSIGSSGPVSMGRTISLGEKSKIKFKCDDSGLGYQTINLQSEGAFGGYGEEVELDINDKYVFSKSLEGKNFYVLSKSFELPFRIDEMIYIVSENYCFIDASEEMKEQFEGISIKELKFADFQTECSDNDIEVCFDGSDCDISVSGEKCEGFFCDNAYEYGIVEKEGKEIRFVTDALMYAAIFSGHELYECNFNRIMKRLGLLIDLYKEKISITEPKCDSESLVQELNTFKGYLSLGSTEQLSISSIELDEENSDLECPIF